MAGHVEYTLLAVHRRTGITVNFDFHAERFALLKFPPPVSIGKILVLNISSEF
jgi:hypothetical protein